MTWTMSSGVRWSIRTIAVAGVIVAMSTAPVRVPAIAATGFGGTPDPQVFLPATPPADPPTNAPQPPPPPAQTSNGEYYNPNDPNDWWPYAGTGSF
jgi:hypothetical protein